MPAQPFPFHDAKAAFWKCQSYVVMWSKLSNDKVKAILWEAVSSCLVFIKTSKMQKNDEL